LAEPPQPEPGPAPAAASAPLGRKRRFLLYGGLNVLITNAALQLLLPLLPIGLATLLSQLINFGLGYVLYGKGVFRVDRLGRRSAAAYGLVSALVWGVNWGGIRLLSGEGVNRNLAALLLVPVLPVISFSLQKRFVFR
jgi:putative flippase GtrA